MKKLLLTGFEPFLGLPVNPTEQIVKELHNTVIGQYEIYGGLLPVAFEHSADRLMEYYEQVNPDDVVLLGLAVGRHRITPERVAINVNDGEADNDGKVYQDDPIDPGGPDAYFSTLPIRRFVDDLNEKGYPAEISNTAGTYLCNNVMYNMLHKIKSSGETKRAGFVHVPASHELAVASKRVLPSWSQADLTEAVKVVVSAMDK